MLRIDPLEGPRGLIFSANFFTPVGTSRQVCRTTHAWLSSDQSTRLMRSALAKRTTVLSSTDSDLYRDGDFHNLIGKTERNLCLFLYVTH